MPSKRRLVGPAEDHDSKWRTTTTHTPSQMVSVYREIFFAGFPGPTNSARRGDGGVGPLVVFPSSLVRELFSRFGPITHFHFDETRGVGAVTFKDGEDAERCYVTAHLSLMRGGAPSNSSSSNTTSESLFEEEGDRGGAGGSASPAQAILQNVFGKHTALLYLEFAQFLPFVNPLLLNNNLSAVTTINRQLLRTFPVCERNQNASTAMWIVYECKNGPIEAHPERVALPGGGSSSVDDLELIVDMVSTLFPVGAGNSHSVTVLDLWAQFYTQFVVMKTQPDAHRIRNRQHRFAAKPSPVQDIAAYCRKAIAEVGGAEGRMLLARFVEDDALHSTMAYLCFKTRMVHDATYASFFREIETKHRKRFPVGSGEDSSTARTVGTSASSIIAATTAAALAHASNLSEEESVAGGKNVEDQLLALSLVSAAINIIENSCKLFSKPPHESGLREEDESFWRVLKTFDEYAASGSAASLVSVCCDPKQFSGASGLLATMPTVQGMLWRTLRLPLAFLAILALGVFMVVYFSQ